ncbi:hypothetical protein PACTADRAFT_3256 [Pachysolen tannophilus NRRL Y-2460]|uniref:Ribosome biogenesis protein ERB1 n=1 Tax=Pachysolen tannophilus NRRL Y-2460 TaxID=669874 RepID=A0A1E4TUZ2_PACTA|nr:hypothetical protein PACTADRAFT_3256 [Pachysolen tannophilus NRRL Y-2460]
MVKKSFPFRKRKVEEEAEVVDQNVSAASDDDINFHSIINDESDSDSEGETESDDDAGAEADETVYESAQEFESASENEGEGETKVQSDDVQSDDSDAEFNSLLGQEPSSNSDLSDNDFDSEDEKPQVGFYADGVPRIIKPEIDPTYDSDDSDVEPQNTIGNIPISAYDEFPHIGYNINGKRIMRPAKGSALDQLLESIDLPEGWTGLLDRNTGSSLNLTQEELELIKKIQQNEQTDDSINPYEPTIEWFTSEKELMPLTAVPEPKRRFVPSKHEAKRIMKIVKAIREGRIIPPDQLKAEQENQEDESLNFDLWETEGDVNEHIMNLRAPKLPPPTNEESYNPPEEYLLTEKEKEEFLSKDFSDRDKNFIPQKYSSLRKVPGYNESIRERFERCLDLYLAPRVRHNKLNIDPDSLIPELPSPKDLRPFPIRCSTIYEGHTSKIRTLSIDPNGLWLATGSDDGTVRIWEILTGREVYKLNLESSVSATTDGSSQDHVESIEWNPLPELGLLAIAYGETIYLVVPPIFGYDIENDSRLKIEHGWGYDTHGQSNNNNKNNNIKVGEDDEDENEGERDDKDTATIAKKVTKWIKPTPEQSQNGIACLIVCKKTVKKLSWHRRGDYFLTVSPDSANTSVLIHQLSKHMSQSPFKKSKGIIMDAKFHPFKPQLFVCSQRYVRIYDLSQQTLLKKLMPGARWLSSIDIHPRGDNLLAASFDKRVLWHDLDLSNTPYKTLRYHDKAVRSIKFHKGGLPLFSSAADDGTIHVFHGMVYDDLMSNPLLVPLKKLTGHKIVNNLGVLDLIWHPKEAWLFSAGSDGTARLWTT